MIKLRRNLAVMLLGSLGIAGAMAQPARAQAGGASANLEGLTVAGKGAVGAKPNRLEIDLEVSAASEITADVIVKYRDAKKRIQEAFATLKMGNVAVEERALNVGQKTAAYNPYMMDTPPARRGKVEVQLTRKLVVKCDNIRDLDEEALLQLVAKLLDVAQDAGAKVGGGGNESSYYYYRYGSQNSGLVRFILDDLEAYEEKAYQAAVDDARGRARRLAKLNGVELGAVAGVREVFVPGEKAQQTQSAYYYGEPASTDEETPKKRIEVSKFQEIPVKVELQVRFATGPAKAAANREGGQ